MRGRGGGVVVKDETIAMNLKMPPKFLDLKLSIYRYAFVSAAMLTLLFIHDRPPLRERCWVIARQLQHSRASFSIFRASVASPTSAAGDIEPRRSFFSLPPYLTLCRKSRK